MRSAKAPIISAGVMIANMPWNMTNTYSGMVPARRCRASRAREQRLVEKSPMKALPSPLKARL